MADNKTISLLLYKHLQGTLSEEEMRELEEWTAASVNNQYLFNEATDEESLKNALKEMHPENLKELRDGILLKINAGTDEAVAPVSIPVVHRINFLKTTWFRYAASILIILGIGAYLWNTNKTTEQPQIAKTESKKNDILPGGQRALLTLADGSTIILDSAANGQLTTQGNSKVIKTSTGQIIYESGSLSSPFEKGGRSDARGEETAGGFTDAFNTMSTPKGGQYQLTLSDGTKVWLNAASSITYPTAFTNKTREVTISGEAYFEVTPNKSKPFIVHIPGERNLSPAGGSGGALRDLEKSKDRRDDEGGLDITVLGTSFNVNAYLNEPSIKTSLSDGSIKINNKILKPGEAYSNGKIIKTNIDQDIAWKNGVFDFNDLTGEQAMRQLARWYDVEIKYQGNIKGVKFGGELDRSLTLNQVLRGLEGIAGLHFELKGNTLIVKR